MPDECIGVIMFRYLCCFYLMLASMFSFADSLLSPLPIQQFNEADKIKMNEFCVQFKESLLTTFSIINNQNVSPETFVLFETETRANVVPGVKIFLEDLRKRGASNCTDF